jgi:hypothetical protein
MSGTMSESLENFSTEELEGLTLEAEGMEEIAEQIEEESLEDLEDLEFSEGAQQELLPLAVLGKFAGKYLFKLLIKLAMKLIMQIAANARLKKRVQDIVKRGGKAAFTRLICAALCKNIPPALRPLCHRFCPVVCNKILPIATRKLGLVF